MHSPSSFSFSFSFSFASLSALFLSFAKWNESARLVSINVYMFSVKGECNILKKYILFIYEKEKDKLITQRCVLYIVENVAWMWLFFFIIKPVYILWVTEWVPSYLSCVLCKKYYYYYYYFLNIASGDSERGLEILFVVAFMVCDEVNFQWLSVNFIDHVRRATIEKFAAVCDKAFSHVLLTAMINMREWHPVLLTSATNRRSGSQYAGTKKASSRNLFYHRPRELTLLRENYSRI